MFNLLKKKILKPVRVSIKCYSDSKFSIIQSTLIDLLLINQRN